MKSRERIKCGCNQSSRSALTAIDQRFKPDRVFGRDKFISEYHHEINRVSGNLDAQRQRAGSQLRQVEKDIQAIIDSIKAGFRTDSMREALQSLEDQKKELKQQLESKATNSIRLHPNLAEVYRLKVEDLRASLEHPDARTEAAGILRDLIDEIRLVPDEGKLRIHLIGQLAALLALAQNKKPGLNKETGLQVAMVAGARNPRQFKLPAVEV